MKVSPRVNASPKGIRSGIISSPASALHRQSPREGNGYTATAHQKGGKPTWIGLQSSPHAAATTLAIVTTPGEIVFPSFSGPLSLGINMSPP